MQTATKYTVEDHLVLDARSDIRHEFWDGEIRAMAGAEPEHNVLKGNIAGALGNRLLERGCHVMASDQRVQLGSRYVHPDVVVTCTPEDADTKPCSFRRAVIPNGWPPSSACGQLNRSSTCR